MSAIGKVVDATVLVGSVAVGYSAVTAIIAGAKIKSTTTILVGGLTLLIGIYAFKEAYQKINEK